MSTFIVNVNDTIVVADGIIVKANKAIETLQPIVKEADTNGYDVAIAISVCAAAVLIVLAIAMATYFWRKQSKEETLMLEEHKQTHENNMKIVDDRIKGNEEMRRMAQNEDRHNKEKALNQYKLDYNQYTTLLKSIVDLARDKEGTINEDILEKLLVNFDTFKDKLRQTVSGKKDELNPV